MLSLTNAHCVHAPVQGSCSDEVSPCANGYLSQYHREEGGTDLQTREEFCYLLPPAAEIYMVFTPSGFLNHATGRAQLQGRRRTREASSVKARKRHTPKVLQSAVDFFFRRGLANYHSFIKLLVGRLLTYLRSPKIKRTVLQQCIIV